jgi:AcrR family transcriptional regulator
MRTLSAKRTAAKPDAETRHAIKVAARRLFAEHGIDGVSIREIVDLAGQRNGGSVHYHFGSKEALVRELIVDGARLIDDLRNARLDAIAARGNTPTLREIVEILVGPALELGEDTYLQFINSLQIGHRKTFMDALGNQWNAGFRRCLAHIRALLPELPEPLLNQRLVFMDMYMMTAMAAREASLNDPAGAHPFWKTPYVMANFLDSMENLLSAPVSGQTMEQFGRRGGKRRRTKSGEV